MKEKEEKKQNVPKRRFPGFTEPWEQRKLGEITEKTYGGGTPKTNITEYWNGDIPWIQSSNLNEHELFKVNILKYVSKRGIDKSATQLIPKNSIAVVSHVGVGKLVYVPFEYTTSQDFISLSGLTTDLIFTCYVLYKKIQEDLNIVQGSAIKGITKSVLLNKDILIPNKLEQQQIGSFLKQFDNLITLHQRKLDDLKLLKKGLLQKMFPKNDEKVPEIRFPDFTDDWEQRKLGELYRKNNERNTDKIPYNKILSVATMKYKDEGNGAADKSISTYKVLRIGDIGYEGHTSKEFSYGRFVLNDMGLGIMSPRFTSLRPIREYPVKFWKYYIHNETIMGPILKRSTKSGTMMNELVVDDLFKETIQVPRIEEQKKIGDLFSKLDNLITLHQRKEIM